MNGRWNRASELRALWDAGCDAETYVDEVLAALFDAIDPDTAVVMLGHASGTASPWRGRDRRDQLSPQALEEVSRSTVEGALVSGRTVVTEAVHDRHHHASAAALGILAAASAPIGRPPRGALYVDFRRASALVGAARTDILEAAAALLAEAVAPTEFVPVVAAAPSEEIDPPSLDELLSLPGLRAMMREIAAGLQTSAPVLVLGETGTGKTLLAQALAARIGRRPVVRAMLGTSDDPNTIVSELYGHGQGSYSGASRGRKGLVEQANGGVLILDEVLNLPLTTQQLLLDFIQFGTYRPLGYDRAEPLRAKVRILAVTNGDLDAAVREGRFRQDLYYRLAGSVLSIPPLRARRGDIPGLATILLPRVTHGQRWRLSLDARRMLVSDRLEWPGNVRQLEASLRRAVERARLLPGPVPMEIATRHLDPELVASVAQREAPAAGASAAAPSSLSDRWQSLQARRAELEQEESALIHDALTAHGGVMAHAAAALGVPRTTLASRVGQRAR